MPYGAVFYLAAAGLVGAGVMTMFVDEPVKQTRATPPPAGALRIALRECLADRAMRWLLLGTFLCQLLETQMFSTFAIYLTTELGLTTADVGLLYACNGAVVLVLQWPALAMIRRLGIGWMLPWSSFLDALGFAVIGFATGFAGGALGDRRADLRRGAVRSFAAGSDRRGRGSGAPRPRVRRGRVRIDARARVRADHRWPAVRRDRPPSHCDVVIDLGHRCGPDRLLPGVRASTHASGAAPQRGVAVFAPTPATGWAVARR